MICTRTLCLDSSFMHTTHTMAKKRRLDLDLNVTVAPSFGRIRGCKGFIGKITNEQLLTRMICGE